MALRVVEVAGIDIEVGNGEAAAARESMVRNRLELAVEELDGFFVFRDKLFVCECHCD
jgi:hypothetical protein